MANYSKLKVIWRNNLNDIYKDNTIIGVGQEAVINMDEKGISSIYVNFKVNNEFFTDLVEINGNIIQVPFKTDVLKAGTHQLEIVAYLRNGDIVPSPTFSYYVEKSLENKNNIKADTYYPILLELLEKVEEWNERIPRQEEQRIANENERKSNEINRQSNEDTRLNNENTRQSNESSRQQYETQRRVEEDERLTDEQVRVNAENIRIANENERLRKEIERQNAEELRQIAYNSGLYGRMDEAEDRLNEVDLQLAHNENVNFNQVNVKDFLKNNENFSSALNSAIEYCKTNTCKRVVIPDGNYILTETVYLYDYIEIYGASSTGTIITCDVRTNNFAFEADTGAFRFKLSNLTLIASESKRGLIGGIDCKNQRYSNINNCYLRYFNTAISFDGSCWANYIEYCRFWNNTTSIDFNRTEDLEEANHVNIRNNEFYDTDTAINNPSGRNVNIISNLFERVKCCIYVGNRLRPVVISQNYFESIENAITVSKGDSTKTILVNENYFEDYNKNDNILIKIEQTTSSQPAIKYLTLNNNFFHSNSSNVKELITVNDYYIVDFYENTFASVNNKPINYYLDLFTTDSTNIPIKHSKFAPGRTDLNILNLSEVLPSTLATRDRNYNCVLKSISSRDNRGMLHLIMKFNVNSFNDDIQIPSSIAPYTSTERVGSVIYSDNSCGLVRVQVGSDGYLRIRGYDSTKTIKAIDIDLTYGNSSIGSY